MHELNADECSGLVTRPVQYDDVGGWPQARFTRRSPLSIEPSLLLYALSGSRLGISDVL